MPPLAPPSEQRPSAAHEQGGYRTHRRGPGRVDRRRLVLCACGAAPVWHGADPRSDNARCRGRNTLSWPSRTTGSVTTPLASLWPAATALAAVAVLANRCSSRYV